VHDSPNVQQVELGWSESAIVERCRVLRRTLDARRVPAPELDAMAPGGASNQVTDTFGAAVTWWALLRARWEQEEAKRQDEEQRAEAAVAAALAAEPAPVELDAAGAPRYVHPKSYHALRFLDALGNALRDVVVAAPDHPDVEVQALAALTESLAVRLWAWILTHAGPGLPFDEGAEVDPPEWTKLLSPADIGRLFEAHWRVNRERVVLIAQLFPPERSVESRLSVAGFLGTVAQELGHRPFSVLRQWSMGEAFAQAVVAAQSAREGREAAERESRERRRPA
jgi:hypothetical protein